MSEIKDLKKSLPDMTHAFSIEEEGMLTRQMFRGDFKSKIPDAKTRAMIAKHKVMLNGGFEKDLDLGTKLLHQMVSYLRYTLTEFPKWWKDADLGYALYDVNVIEKVYDEVLAFEKTWYESIWGPEVPEEETKADEQTTAG